MLKLFAYYAAIAFLFYILFYMGFLLIKYIMFKRYNIKGFSFKQKQMLKFTLNSIMIVAGLFAFLIIVFTAYDLDINYRGLSAIVASMFGLVGVIAGSRYVKKFLSY